MTSSTISPPQPAKIIANYIIWFCHEHGDPITNLKLQKLLYYAQGWYLALKNKPLFSNRIEAWIHGPVVPEVYHLFKKYTFNPISKKIKQPLLSKEIIEHLDEIIKVFGCCSAYELELMTHREDPWIKARGTVALDESCQNEILIDNLKNYFSRIAAENEE